MNDELIISLENVTKAFGSFVVATNLNMSVRRGEIVALLGQTGAGKSTIMNMIMGTHAPTSGKVRVSGYDPHREFNKLRGKLAVSFQTDRLLPWRTAVENAELGLLILGKGRHEARQTALTWLSRVRLESAENKYVHELSGGMRQRVSLARALCVDPDLVLLDESFSQLDHVTSKTLRKDFSDVVREYQKTCLFVTHRIEDALEMADRIIVLKAGAGIALEQEISPERRADKDWLTTLHDRIAVEMGAGSEQVEA